MQRKLNLLLPAEHQLSVHARTQTHKQPNDVHYSARKYKIRTTSNTTATTPESTNSRAVGGHIQSEALGAMHIALTIDPHQRIGLVIKGVFERNHDGLKLVRILHDVVAYFEHINVVQCCIHFIHDEEWRWLSTVNGKQECQRCDGFLTTYDL
jgi:hypothetical protein